jgi:hypothetical protein
MAKSPKEVPLWRRELDNPAAVPAIVVAAEIATEPNVSDLPATPLGIWREGIVKKEKRPICAICRKNEVPASRPHSKTCSPECGKALERRRDNKPARKARRKALRREKNALHPKGPVEKNCIDCGDKFTLKPRGKATRCEDCRRKRRNDQQNVRYHADVEAKRKDARDRRAANPEKFRRRARGYYRLDAKKIRPAQNARRKAKREPRELWCKYCQSYFEHMKPGRAPEACPKPKCQEAKLAARKPGKAASSRRSYLKHRKNPPRAPAKRPWLAEGISRTTWYRRKRGRR